MSEDKDLEGDEYVVGRIHHPLFTATLTGNGWTVVTKGKAAGDGPGATEYKKSVEESLNYSHPLIRRNGPNIGQPGVRSLCTAAKEWNATKEIITTIDPLNEPGWRY